MKPIYIIPLLGILSLAGCAHQQPQPPKTQENFSTLIKPDGAKQFSYSLTTELPGQKDSGGRGGHGGHGEHSGHGGHGDGHGGPGGHGDGPPGDHKGMHSDAQNDVMEEKFALIFEDALNLKLNSTGFCRNGFIQLDKQVRRGAILIKGECNETASDADREKFPNPTPKKIKVDVLE